MTRLAEDPTNSIETIRQLAGHVNDRMLARYAHIRVQALRDASDANLSKRRDLKVVGVSRFERPTTRTPSVCATRLRHTPTPDTLHE